jgi:hypothetical protein
VRLIGPPVSFAAEIDRVEANIDHFWITVRVGNESVRIALSTRSRQNAVAGFDPRIRLAIIAETWAELPSPLIEKSTGLNYGEIDAALSPAYLEQERPALEQILHDRSSRAAMIEAWGELYIRTHLGIHQIHSMRASCSVPRDFVGRDGAIRFYFADEKRSELLLFKYCGQP